MKEKPYIIRGDNYLDTPCIVKINYGKKYVIVKCLSQPGALKNIEDSLNAYFRGGKNNETGLYYFLFEYVKKHPEETFTVETLLKSDSPYELLKREQEELDAGRFKMALLNNQLTAYIPAYNEDKRMYGWIPPAAVLNFNNWLKKTKKDRGRKPKIKKSKKQANEHLTTT